MLRILSRFTPVIRRASFATNAFLVPRKVINSLQDDQLRGKNVFVRVDFNVPQDKKTLKITDDTRIREALPTINYLREKGAKVILASHLGRPKDGKRDPKYSLKPCVDRLAQYLKAPVAFTSDCVGLSVTKAVDEMKPGDVLLLENARFQVGEEKNDIALIRKLAEHTKADVYVNDAFGTAHRAHATTAGVRPFIRGPAVAGFLMAKEIKFLFPLVTAPAKPFVAIIGGAKVDTKIGVIKSLLEKCDKLLLGGAMIFPFYKAQGLKVACAMPIDDKALKIAKDVMEAARKKGVQLVLPTDLVCADAFKADAKSKECDATNQETGWMGLDIGPKTLATFQQALKGARTVFWNGPMGVFEFPKFAQGTLGVAQILAGLTEEGATTVVGGGDSVAAVQQSGLADKISHISTGGGASLELLEGATLPGIDVLEKAN